MTENADFADLLAANRRYARSFPHGFDGIAHEGVLMLTCMDSRIEPLEMVGLRVGEAKILRTPGGRLTEAALAGIVLGVLTLRVNRVLIVPHTKCAAATSDDAALREQIKFRTGVDVGDFAFGASTDQLGNLRRDVEAVQSNELIADRVKVGGFLYDVETGLLHPIC